MSAEKEPPQPYEKGEEEIIIHTACSTESPISADLAAAHRKSPKVFLTLHCKKCGLAKAVTFKFKNDEAKEPVAPA